MANGSKHCSNQFCDDIKHNAIAEIAAELYSDALLASTSAGTDSPAHNSVSHFPSAIVVNPALLHQNVCSIKRVASAVPVEGAADYL